MIERKILADKVREKEMEKFVLGFLGKLSCSHVVLQRTPLGEKISVYTSRPGLVVGRKGENIKAITAILKKDYNMENPQIEVAEIEDINLDAASIAKNIVGLIENYGPKRFKPISHRATENCMRAGAKGVEIVVAGRGVPSERSKTWRFSAGYMKKSGYVSEAFVDRHSESCNLKSGMVGVKVSVLKPDVVLPDDLNMPLEEEDKKVKIEEIKTDEKKEIVKEEKKKEPKKAMVPKEKNKKEIKNEAPKKEVKPVVKEEPKEEVKVEEKKDESEGNKDIK